MLLESALTPGAELLLQLASEPTDGAGTGSHSHQRLGDFSNSVSTRASHQHLGQALGHLWFRATRALEHLGMELTLAISGNQHVLDPTRGAPQAALGETVALPFAAAGCSLPSPLR